MLAHHLLSCCTISTVLWLTYAQPSSSYSTSTASPTTNLAYDGDSASCNAENANGVLWPPTNYTDPQSVRNIASTPWCLDHNAFLRTRQCHASTGTSSGEPNWSPIEAPDCHRTQPPPTASQIHCPPGLQLLREPTVVESSAGATRTSPVVCARLSTTDQPGNEFEQCTRLGVERTVLDLNDDELLLVANHVAAETRQRDDGHTVGVWLPAEWIEPNRLLWQRPASVAQQRQQLQPNETGGNDGGGGGRLVQLAAQDVGQPIVAGNGCTMVRFDMQTGAPRLAKRPCDQQRRMLCVYAETQLMLRLACPLGRYATRYAAPPSSGAQQQQQQQQQPCAAIESRPRADRGALLKLSAADRLPLVAGLYAKLSWWRSSVCTFDAIGDAVARYDGVHTMDWQLQLSEPNAADAAPFVNWDVATEFTVPNDIDYIVCDARGKWSLAYRFECSLVGEAHDASVGEPSLTFSRPATHTADSQVSSKVRMLTVRNPRALWRTDVALDRGGDAGVASEAALENGVQCFWADERQQNIRNVATWPLVGGTEMTANVYNVSIDEPGVYWCEAHDSRTFASVRTADEHVDSLDHFVGIVWRQVGYANVSVALDEWLLRAMLAAQLTDAIRVENVTVRAVASKRTDVAIFLVITFRVSVRFVTGRRYQPDADLLQFTEYGILRANAKHALLMRALQLPPFHFPAVNSTEFCLPELRVATGNRTLWPGGRIGEVHTSTAICWVADGQPTLRRCVGDAENGANWSDLTQMPCRDDVVVPAVTQRLHTLSTSFRYQHQTAELLGSVRQLVVAGGVGALAAFDVISIGNIMTRACELNRNVELAANVMSDVLDIYDGLMALDVAATVAAAKLNATNQLLAALEAMLANVSPPVGESVLMMEREHFQAHLIDPNAVGRQPNEPMVSGIALYAGGRVEYLTDEQQNVERLFEQPDLEVAAFLPDNLLDKLVPLNRLVVSVFDNDVLFQTAYDGESAAAAASSSSSMAMQRLRLQSRIISVSVPNVDTKALPAPVPVFFRYDPDSMAAAHGCFWSLDNRHGWLDEGFDRVTNSGHVVQYNARHLTNFALILRDWIEFGDEDARNLFLITLVGSALSLAGLLGIFMTALRFSSWRCKASNQLLLQLSTAIAGMLLLFMFSDNREALAQRTVCVAVGAALHYLVLVTFVWMLVMAYLQFMRYVVVFGQMRSEWYVLKLSVVSWSVPLLPVAIVLAIDPELYVSSSSSSAGSGEVVAANRMCYPTGVALYAGVMAPIGLIIVCNVIVYVMVIYNLMRMQMTNRSIVMAQLRVSTFLFFLLGLTWVFGFFSRSDGPSLLFAYLFCATATLQGLVLFVYFVVLDAGTRRLWTEDLRSLCGLQRRGSLTLEAKSSRSGK